MGIFTKTKTVADTTSPMENILGRPIMMIDGIGCNLFVHEKCLVFDRTQGGLLNVGNRTYKIIPIKAIVSLQVKSTGALSGYLQVSTYAHDAVEIHGLNRVDDENTVNFNSEDSVRACQQVVDYLTPLIL